MKVKPITIDFQKGTYVATAIARVSREDFVSKNITHFLNMLDGAKTDEEKQIAQAKRREKLGQLWDMANEAVNPPKKAANIADEPVVPPMDPPAANAQAKQPKTKLDNSKPPKE